MESINPHRLPSGVSPDRYRVTLRPDIAAATFSGRVSIEATAAAATNTVVLNAIELDVTAATVATDSGHPLSARVDLDQDLERLTLTVDEAIPAGPVAIDLEFDGVLNDKLRGFYRSSFTDDDGNEHTIATTQFESTNARRCFPCWDEPAIKAVFEVALEVPSHMLAISAMGEVGRRDIGDGLTRVEFAPTPLMSTYLLAFVVGELEASPVTDAGGVPLRIIHRPGRGDEIDFARDAATFCVQWLTEYFGVPYFGDKIDLLAIPDFAFGAMENTGCVTFREVYLLVDPDSTTLREQQLCVAIIAHELAHMWFGNLVTMAWWEGLWLKEAFATFMEISASDAYRPDWRVWESFARDRSAAFETDALHSTRAIEFEVHSPDDAEAMYDVLTYEKGASVVRMLEQFVGPDNFRDGIRHYMQTHGFANTVTSDLWNAIGSATDLPVAEIMHEWIYTGGFPLVDARLAGDQVELDQQPFRVSEPADARQAAIDAALEWKIPVSITATTKPAQADTLLMAPHGRIPLEDPTATVVVDPDSHGFFRTRYDDILSQRLADELMGLSAPQRYRLFDDTYNLVLAGLTPIQEYVALARRLEGEDSHPVWSAVSGAWHTFSHMAATRDDQARIGEIWSEVARPALDRLGLDRPYGEGDDLRNEVRATLYQGLGILSNDSEVLAHARSIHQGEHSVDNPSVEAAAMRVVAANGDRADYDDLLGRYRSETSLQAARRALFALALFDDQDAIDDLCARTLDGSVRSQEVGILLAQAMGNRWHGARVWDFVTEHWDAIVASIPDNLVSRMVSGVEWLDHDGADQRVHAFLAERDIPQARMAIAQHLERLDAHVKLRGRFGTEWPEPSHG